MIPIILINRDRLTCTRNLINHLLKLGYDDLYILDMDSTYEPLLDYYNACKDFTLIRHQNTGHKTLWNNGILKELFGKHEWVCVTDSDIELSPDTPNDFIEQMIIVAKDYRIDKVGLAIKYKGISPNLSPIIDPIESQYWKQLLVHQKYSVYLAPVDTTLCIVKPNLPFQYSAVRIANWPIKHLDWYQDWNNLSDEDQYYLDHADENIATTKQHYLKWKESL